MEYIIIGAYVVGVVLAWNRISNGVGFPVNWMPPNTISKINALTPGGIVVKVLLSLVFGYIIFAFIVMQVLSKYLELLQVCKTITGKHVKSFYRIQK